MPGNWEFNAANFDKAAGSLSQGATTYSDGMGAFASALGKASAAKWNMQDATKQGQTAFSMVSRKAENASGEFVNNQGNSGLRFGGSVAEVLKASENMGIKDAYAAKLEFDMEAINQKYEYKAQKRSAKLSKRQANVGAASSIIGSVAAFRKTT
jgi:hypothetical protein